MKKNVSVSSLPDSLSDKESILDGLELNQPALAEAQKGLTERPTRNIRTKMILGFFFLFIFSAGVSITYLMLSLSIEKRVNFMETLNNYTFEIQQARRFEKNFFLYRTNLPDALENVQTAREILKQKANSITAVVGQTQLTRINAHLDRYEKLLNYLRTGPEISSGQIPKLSEIETELRQHGAEMIFSARNLVDQEKKQVDDITRLSHQLPLAFLIVFLGIVIYLAIFLARQIVQPLNRFVEYTRRIAKGDYTPITAAKPYKDEFSRLAMAINWMMDQLQKNQEQYIQSRKMAAIGTLTSGIAHELNNPLNNICITTESMLDELEDLSDQEKRKRLQDIYTQAERASGTVRNLLDFTRMGQPTFVPVSCNELLSSTLKLARNEMELNNIKLLFSQERTDPKALGDFGQLQQVFLNLVINAIQAMPQGGTLDIEVKTDDPEWVQIDLSDSGIGIPQSVIEQIFDPFFTTKEKGTGLGLSTSYSIIKKHGGKILVKSQLNQGTTFSVFIPKSKEK